MAHLLFTDGGARGNPGIGGAGAILSDAQGIILGKASQKLGICTNNQAEYMALILGLNLAIKNKISELTVFMDSNLVVEQVSGNFKVKNADLKKLFLDVQKLILKFKKISFKHIPRAKNKLADKLANEAMDAQM
ncbi:MAG: ribonuclease HI family protein [Patescibacteria group bacterium]|nr:ribonuclease HI family protein [Patescibacteria group bacterium]